MYAVLVLAGLLVFQGCRKDIVPDLETVPELPEIVLRAQEWIREYGTLSRGQELEIEALDFHWEQYALGENSLGQEIVSVPARNPADAGGGYTELAFGVDDAGEPQGVVKRYAGDMAGESVLLRLYTVTGEKAMAGTYYPATGKFSPRGARGGIVKIAKAKEKTLDGGTIEEVHVTAKRNPGGGGSWGSLGGRGGQGGGSFGGEAYGGGSSGGIGFASGTGTSSNFILIEAVPVKGVQKSNGMSFPLLPFLLDDGSVVQTAPSPIRINFAGGNAGFNSRVESVLLGIKNGKFGNADYGCFAAAVLKAVQSKQGANGALNISLKASQSGPNGAYNPATRTMEYIYADYVDAMSTFHEILHYYQDLSGHYPNMKNMGIGPGGKKSKGFANIEFEVRLILDIMKGYGDEYVYELDESDLPTNEMQTIIEDYERFIKSFKGADKKLLNPEAMNMTKFGVDYTKFLGYYATKSKNYRSDVDINLKPKALLELLKTVYNNCK